MADQPHPYALASVQSYQDDDGIMKPVIIEDPRSYPFAPGERETEWRAATVAEVETYRHDYQED